MEKGNKLFFNFSSSLGAACIAMSISVHSFAENKIIHSLFGRDKAITQSLPLSGFDKIAMQGKFTIIVQPGKKEAVAIAADKNILPMIHSVVTNNTLTISMKPHTATTPSKTQVTITSDTLRNVTLDGENVLNANNITSDHFVLTMDGKNTANLQGTIKKFELNMAGDAKVKAHINNARAINLKSGGKATADLAGATQQLTINTAGKTKVNANNLIADDVVIHSAGKSEITVNATKTLAIKTAGKSTIRYYGNPKVDKDIFGKATIEKIEKN